jgi:hypothetical protein
MGGCCPCGEPDAVQCRYTLPLRILYPQRLANYVITDRERISESRDWQNLHTEIQRINKAPNTLPITKKLLNHMQPLPRTVANLVGYFISAIKPFETDFNVLWGLLHLNLMVCPEITPLAMALLMNSSSPASPRTNSPGLQDGQRSCVV